MKLTQLSPSAMSTWDWCQWKYWLQYALKFRDPAGHSALAGTIGHKVLELLAHARLCQLSGTETFKDRELNAPFFAFEMPSVDILWAECFEYFCSTQPAGPKLRADKAKTKGVRAGIDWVLAGEHNPCSCNVVSIEQSFDLFPEGPDWILGLKEDGTHEKFKITGRIDRIDQPDKNAYRVYDYKFGKATNWPPGSKDHEEKTLDDFYDDIQCLTYYYEISRRFPWAKSIEVVFVYPVERKVFPVALGAADVENLKQKVLEKRIAIEQGQPRRNPGWYCKHLCNHGKTGTCEQIWQEKELYGMEFVEEFYKLKNTKDKK